MGLIIIFPLEPSVYSYVGQKTDAEVFRDLPLCIFFFVFGRIFHENIPLLYSLISASFIFS